MHNSVALSTGGHSKAKSSISLTKLRLGLCLELTLQKFIFRTEEASLHDSQLGSCQGEYHIHFNGKEERIRAGQTQGLYEVLFKAKAKMWMLSLIALLPLSGPVEKES